MHAAAFATHVSQTVASTMPLVDDGFEALLEPFYNGKKLTDPISTKEDKFQLLPAFLKVKGMGISRRLSCKRHGLISVRRSCETV